MVVVSCCVPPTPIVAELGETVTPVTATLLTVTAHVAVFPPSTVVTVIVPVPAATAVTKPLLFTVAIDALLVLYVTFLFEALPGETVGVNCWVLPTASAAVVGLTVTPVTGTLLTVTAHVAVLDWSTVVTVMVAVPEATAVINPEVLTNATALLLDA